MHFSIKKFSVVIIVACLIGIAYMAKAEAATTVVKQDVDSKGACQYYPSSDAVNKLGSSSLSMRQRPNAGSDKVDVAVSARLSAGSYHIGLADITRNDVGQLVGCSIQWVDHVKLRRDGQVNTCGTVKLNQGLHLVQIVIASVAANGFEDLPGANVTAPLKLNVA